MKKPNKNLGEITLRITKPRTETKDSVLEALELEAAKQGISPASLAMVILSAHRWIRNRIGEK